MRVLIAGLGAIGQRHARNLRALVGAPLELLAFRRRRLRHVVTEALHRDADRDAEAELGIVAFADLDEALARRPDAVFVCTPSSAHLHVAQRAAGAGCHLFIEKPLSHTLAGVDALRNSVAERGLVAMVGCQWRFHPGVQWLREVIGGGALGPLHSAAIDYAEYLPDWHPYEDYRTSYAARAELGGGVVLTQIHDYDLAWWLFGPARSVSAAGGRLSDLEIDVEDTVDAHLDCERTKVRIRQSFAARSPLRVITVTAERGTISLDLLAGRTSARTDVPLPEAPPPRPRNQMFVDEVSHFLACMAARTTPLIPIDDGMAVLRLALAVKEAMATGRTVMLQ